MDTSKEQSILEPIPQVQPGDWISIGENYPYVNAVVCTIHKEKLLGDDLEIVYLDGHKAINTGVVWKQNHWQFTNSGPSGGYADNFSRLSDYVAILKGGRHYH